MAVLDYYLSHEIQGLMKNNVRLRVIGDLQGFSNSILKKIDRAVQDTANNTGLNLTVALGYGGQADMTQAVIALAQKVKEGEIKDDSITPDLLKSHLYTRELPAVDLLLRTGKEKRISNFLLWDLAYAELVFIETLWPDFTIAMLDDVLNEFTARHRRFGGDELVMNASDVKTLPSAG
jgi:undecaprenyl diphosphate synthase